MKTNNFRKRRMIFWIVVNLFMGQMLIAKPTAAPQDIKQAIPVTEKYGDLEIIFPDVASSRGYLNIMLVQYEKWEKSATGKKKVNKFPPDNSYKDSPYQMRIPAVKGLNKAVFKRIPNGKYALAVMHDENSNDDLDYLLGFDLTLPPLPNWPVEGYGFSNRKADGPSFLFPPKIEKALIDVNGQSQTKVKLNYFWARFGIFTLVIPLLVTLGVSIL